MDIEGKCIELRETEYQIYQSLFQRRNNEYSLCIAKVEHEMRGKKRWEFISERRS